MGTWVAGPNQAPDVAISVGDIVILKYLDTFDYAIGGEVTFVSGDTIDIRVLDIHDWHDSSLIIKNADILLLKDKPITCKIGYVHRVVHKQ